MEKHTLSVSAIVLAIITCSPTSYANTTQKRLTELEQRLLNLETKLSEKDKKIAELEQANNITADIASTAATLAISNALTERSSHQFNTPDKSIQLTNSDTTLQIGGQIWLDGIYSNGEMTNRGGFQPSAISYDANATTDNTLFNVGQSKLFIKSQTPSEYGILKTRFEFDLFQSDGDPDLHITHLWAEIGAWGVGQTFSGFMDINAFPNIIDYWGPNAMVFARQPQVRYSMAVSTIGQLMFTLERSDSDLANPNFLNENPPDYQEKNDFGDITASYLHELENGYFKVATIARSIGFESSVLDDSVLGWGINLTGNYALDTQNTLKFLAATGKGIGRYVNDTCCTLYADQTGGYDAGLNEKNELEAIGITAGFLYLDHAWSNDYTSSVGVSYVNVDPLSTQFSRALSTSFYSSANVIWNPTPSSRVGAELMYGKVESIGGESDNDVRLQLSAGLRY